MASCIFKFHAQAIETSNPSLEFHRDNAFFTSLPFCRRGHAYQLQYLSYFPTSSGYKLKIRPLSLQCALSAASNNPPNSKEEAILQAKISLSTTLEKPLNNPKLVGKLKKLKQPRFRVEIPVVDDSPGSLSQLALEFFGDISIKRKGSLVNILVVWQNPTLAKAAAEAFVSRSSNAVENTDVSSLFKKDSRFLNSADMLVFLAPEASQLADMKTVVENSYPKPVVIFNPCWSFEEENSFGELIGFVGSFEVVYSFMGLEVRGILSKRKGVIFRCVRDGVLSGDRWSVLVEEEGKLKLVSSFKARPSIAEVENVLYNLMAINSPITKSAKFLKGLVSNVTRKK